VIDRRSWSAAMLGGLALPAWANAAEPDTIGANILRVPLESAETGFDPAQISEHY
jgi:hypothetical protein